MAQTTPKSQSCEAWLIIGTYTYEGKTGRDHGHAEMDALHQYVENVGDGAEMILKDYIYKRVYCPSRPVCANCAYVLKKLGFEPQSNEAGTTVWGNKKMGSTEWGVTMKVRNLLKACNIDYETAKQQG